MKRSLFLFLSCTALLAQAQVNPNDFQPLTWELPAPDECRLASGAPGPKYWQQRADYSIAVTLDDANQTLSGTETITYYNQSPHTLTYLWVQVDQNLFAPNSLHYRIADEPENFNLLMSDLAARPGQQVPGCNITSVTEAGGAALKHTIVETNMRVDLPQPLEPGKTFTFSIAWNYKINDATIEGRCGYEYFPEDKNFIYEFAQFYPRMCLYDNVKGWQNMPYMGPAEFGLEFGNFEVKITAPADMVVPATGTLQNESEVLSAAQLERLAKIRSEVEVVSPVITAEEAAVNEKSRSTSTRTWVYKAQNVRDFAFAASRKFVWDAAAVKIGGRTVLAQSFYPREAMPVWSTWATHAIMTTLKVYGRYSVEYPYESAIAVNGPVWGMEYPMICFCGGRPETPSYYSKNTKYSTISVIIHEVGHNFFPMIINNDERRWAWMDEGFNSFFQYLTEKEFEPNYPHRRGNPAGLAEFLDGPSTNPILTNPESIIANGNTSYGKTAAGLYLLREKIMGPAVFDMAFKEYARRWAFRHPEPADFFRTMEDASGVNLDWFWRNWFMQTEPVDFALKVAEISRTTAKTWESPFRKEAHASAGAYYVSDKPALKDKYTEMVPVINEPYSALTDAASRVSQSNDGTWHYTLLLTNEGGCPLPLTVTAVMAGGEVRHIDLPAEIWIKNSADFIADLQFFNKVYAFVLDFHNEWPDHDRGNDFVVIVTEEEGKGDKKKPR